MDLYLEELYIEVLDAALWIIESMPGHSQLLCVGDVLHLPMVRNFRNQQRNNKVRCNSLKEMILNAYNCVMSSKLKVKAYFKFDIQVQYTTYWTSHIAFPGI
jgi:hypothetical protein